MSLLRSHRPWLWLPLCAVAACNTPTGGGPTSDFPFTGGNSGGLQPSMDAGVGGGGPAGEAPSTGGPAPSGGTGSMDMEALDGGGFAPPFTGGGDAGGSQDAAAPPECAHDVGLTDAGADASSDGGPEHAGDGSAPHRPLAADSDCDAGLDGSVDEAGATAPQDDASPD